MTASTASKKSRASTSFVPQLKGRRLTSAKGREIDLLAHFDAQLGEIGWHSTHVDESIDNVSQVHADRIVKLARDAGLKEPRILELGAYAHYSAQIAAKALGGSAVSHDISAASVSLGQSRAKALGYDADHMAVAGDFHSLPFHDNAFDITFIASAVHHTWRPWMVMQEMVRVTRPGGIIHLENEPVGRAASLYQFRGNRPGEFTPFEQRLEDAGLIHTLISPFPGSRAEKLFGIIENDRITLEIFENSLLNVGSVIEWSLEMGATINEFERWLLDERPTASLIAEKIRSGVLSAWAAFGDVDEVCEFSVPSDDQIWPLAYRLEATLAELSDVNTRDVARLFGAALRASIRKHGDGPRSEEILKTPLIQDGDVYIDDANARARRIKFMNVLPAPEAGVFGPDWYVMPEADGFYTLANIGPDCNFPVNAGEGFLILRAYSVEADQPYYFSVIRNGELVYSHGVARSESHMAKVFVEPGDTVSIHHHNGAGEPVDLQFHTRLIPKFVPTA